MSIKIGLFYGSSTCYTEMAGEKIRDQINGLLNADVVLMHNIADDPISLMEDYNYLILGIPTWDYGELQEDWETHWDDIDSLDLHMPRRQSMVWEIKSAIRNGFKMPGVSLDQDG